VYINECNLGINSRFDVRMLDTCSSASTKGSRYTVSSHLPRIFWSLSFPTSKLFDRGSRMRRSHATLIAPHIEGLNLTPIIREVARIEVVDRIGLARAVGLAVKIGWRGVST
jgi:hypothetical protein